MEVVINVCFGGFGLSDKAEDLYAKKSGFDVFRYHQTKHEFKDGFDLYERGSGGISYTFKKDHGDSFSEWPKDGSYWYSDDTPRDDKVLVSVVRELGDEANGECAKLSIVKIPDGTEWEVTSYDGNELVEEKHRLWR